MKSKQTRAPAFESVDHLKMILNEAGLGIWDLTIDLEKTESDDGDLPIDSSHAFISDIGLEMAGYSPGDFGATPREILATWLRKLHPEDSAKAFKTVEAIISGENEKFSLKYRIQNKNGGWKWILSKGLVVERDPDGKSLRIAGVLADIDNVVDAEAEKHRYQRRFDRIVEDAHIGIFIAEDGIIRYVNNSVERLSGYSRSELIGMKFVDIAYDDDRKMVMNRHLNRLKGYNATSCYTVRARNKAGKLKWLEVDSMPFEWEERPTILVFLRDITLDKALEKRELHTQKIQAIGTLAGGIAHDFNNILSAIMGFTEICMMESSTDSLLSKRLGRVMTAANRAKDLVGQILAFSRQDEASLIEVNFAVIVKEVVKFIKASTSSKITIKTDVRNDLGTIIADPTQLHQVVMNLCTNAVYAMRDGYGILDITLSERVLDNRDHAAKLKNLAPGEYLCLSVSDSGRGMSPEIIKNIFDPYFTTKPIGEGTGLGLSVAHGIIAGFNGAIDVYSEEGNGSVFHVYIPKYADTDKADAVDERPIVGGDETILLVDDEEMLLEMTQERLEALGYTVVSRSNGIEAFQAFIDNPQRFDLVFSDYAMPGLTGIDLARRIREVDTTTPIILCSGFSREISRQMMTDYGIGAVLNKPLLIRDITETIRQLLD